MKIRSVFTVLLSALLALSIEVSADDTDVFFARPIPYTPDMSDGQIPAPNPNYPNILFILDASDSMNRDDPPLHTTSRISRLRIAMEAILKKSKNVNIGVMRFSHNKAGGRIIYPMSPIEYAREDAIEVVKNMKLDWFTPAIGAILEAGYYWQCDSVFFGRNRYGFHHKNHYNNRRSRVSHPQSYTGGELDRHEVCETDLDNALCVEERITGGAKYVSPITSECQANYQVVIADGATHSIRDPERVHTMTGGVCAKNMSDERFTCGVELAEHMANSDMNENIPGINTVKTYAVGFNTSLPQLEEIALAGGGKYLESSSADQLVAALSSVIEDVSDDSQFFAAPAISMDQITRLSHRNDIYLALFQPNNKLRWSGNLKKYIFDGAVKDQNGESVLDLAGGEIKDTAHSYWSEAVDGGEVANGGAANRMDDITARNVYTFTGSGTKDLTDQVNELSENNLEITRGMLNIPDATDGELTNLLRWARGVDVDDQYPGEVRLHMGDPLHSRPLVVNYAGGNETSNSVVYVGTNEGYLHAIDTNTGNELFSFVPPELLQNLDEYYQNPITTNRIYGLDGDFTLWVNDSGNDGVVSIADDHAYLYMGMRRGGQNYTALDITNPAKPLYKWSINGGDTGFEKLGQSWSKPTLSTIAINGVATKVLIFGGGYDPWQDQALMRSADTVGNDLFIVNAESGALLWSTATDAASYTKMEYSIPSDVSVLDTNGDGFSDQIYVGDMGGQVWRFDIDNGSTATHPDVSGGVIAELSGISSNSNRRFFYRPDVTLVTDGKTQFLSVSIGSGNRAKPLDANVDDSFYMIRQRSIFGAPEGYGIVDKAKSTDTNKVYRAITEADLYDATENLIDSNNVTIAAGAKDALLAKEGWRMSLEVAGEKVLAPSLTVNNQVIFSTYVPDVMISNYCAPAVGGGRSYSVSVLDGTPTNGANKSDRFETLASPGIPPEPVPHIDDQGNVEVIVGVENIDTPPVKLVRRVFWTEQPDY